MEFKILNQDELELLDDNQRKQYERELSSYQHRAAFVEQLERLEDVRIDSYEPKLKTISVMDEIEISSFKKTEYVISLCEPVAKPDLQITPFRKPEEVMPVLPSVTNGASVRETY